MLTYRTQLIPKERTQRPGYILRGGRAASITVHNTANPNATADNHADWLSRENTRASAHIFVDDKEAVMTIPLNEHAWHAGITAGNATSVGIEVCEFSDRARQDATDDNAQRLIADMLTGKAPAGWNLTHLALKDVRTHQSWHQYGADKPGKYCPRMLLPWWDRFVDGVRLLMEPQEITYKVMACSTRMAGATERDQEFERKLKALCTEYAKALFEARESRPLPPRLRDWWRLQ